MFLIDSSTIDRRKKFYNKVKIMLDLLENSTIDSKIEEFEEDFHSY